MGDLPVSPFLLLLLAGAAGGSGSSPTAPIPTARTPKLLDLWLLRMMVNLLLGYVVVVLMNPGSWLLLSRRSLQVMVVAVVQVLHPRNHVLVVAGQRVLGRAGGRGTPCPDRVVVVVMGGRSGGGRQRVGVEGVVELDVVVLVVGGDVLVVLQLVLVLVVLLL